MKTIIPIICLLASLNAYCGDLFSEGSCWISQISGSQRPDASPIIEKEYIVKENGELNVYVENANDENSRHFPATIKRIGNKIYFKPFKDSEKLFLMYDFGLQPGDTTSIWSIYDFNILSYGDSSTVRIPSGLKIKCKSRYKYESYGNVEVIRIEAYPDESCKTPIGEDLWLNGISSLAGLTRNKQFLTQGIGSKLQEVSKNGKIYWESSESTVPKDNYREGCKKCCDCKCCTGF